LKGYLNGAIAGVDINQLLTAFSEAKDKVFGTAQIPDLQVSFAGANADELLDSLSGRGTITMEDGRIAVFDIFSAVAAQAQKVLSGEITPSGETSFVRFFSRWQIGNRRLLMSDILMESGSSSLSGEGFLTFDHALNFDLMTTLTGPLAVNLGGKSNAKGLTAAQIPVKVSGTLAAPKVRPDIAQAAKQQVEERVTDLLDSLFKTNSGESKP
jgi:AsmA protein